ncbi:21209_t:CDS:1, partial [Racocetra persica]
LKSSKINFKAIIKSDIASLEEKIKELEEAKGLQEELKEVENKIRGVIREHILNNKEEINNVLGGDILIKSITAKDNSDSSPDELDFSELRKKEEELGKQLEEKGVEDQTLEQIEDEIKKKERELLDLKKQLLNDEEIFKG